MSSALRMLVVCGLVAVAVAGAGCKRVPPSGGATGSKADRARKQAEDLAVAGFAGAAAAYANATDLPRGSGAGPLGRAAEAVAGGARVSAKTGGQPAYAGPAVRGAQLPKSPPRPGSPPVVRERVASSIPFPAEADADEDALTAAQKLIEQRLAELDPPIDYRPSLNEVRNEYLRKDSRHVRPPTPDEQKMLAGFEQYVGKNLVSVEYDVEVTAEQVRALRTRDRVAVTLRVFAGVSVVSVLGFLFLRFDERTKGYLTRWLAVAAAVLAAGAGVVLYFV